MNDEKEQQINMECVLLRPERKNRKNNAKQLCAMRGPKQRKNVELGLSRPSRVSRAICPRAERARIAYQPWLWRCHSGSFGLLWNSREMRCGNLSAYLEPFRCWGGELCLCDGSYEWLKRITAMWSRSVGYLHRENALILIFLCLFEGKLLACFEKYSSTSMWCGWSVNVSRKLHSTPRGFLLATSQCLGQIICLIETSGLLC